MTFSIRKKSLLITAAVFFLSVAVIVATNSFIFTKEYTRVLHANAFIIGESLASQLTKLLDLGIPLNNLTGFSEQCSDVVKRHGDISYAWVADLRGRVLFTGGTQENRKEIPAGSIQQTDKMISIVSLDGEEYYEAVIPVLDTYGKRAASVGVGFHKSLVSRKTNHLIRSSALVAFGLFSLAIVILFFALSHWVIQPLRKLTAVIAEIGQQGALSRRVDIASKDEIGELAASFNRMTGDLEKSTTSVANLNREIEERKKTEESLRQSEEEFRLTFEHAKDAIVWADPQTGVVLKCNKAAELLFERPRDEIVGLHQTALHPPDKGDRYKKVFANHSELKNAADDDGEIVTRSGRIVPVNITSSVVSIRGKLVMQGLFRDLTEKKKAEWEKEKLQGQLAQTEKMATVGLLASGVAHEINNPLTIILALTQILLRKTTDGEPLRHDLKSIEEAVMRCKKIISGLLAFGHQQESVFNPVSVNDVLKETLQLFGRQLELENITVRQDLADLPPVSGNSNHLSQVFLNLLVNARDAIKNKGEISIATRPKDSFVEIKIADTGEGIPKELLNRIFDPFFTTKPTGSGTGLGLSVCLGIIEKHQGQLSVASEVGKGTEFTILLPLTRKPDETNPGH